MKKLLSRLFMVTLFMFAFIPTFAQGEDPVSFGSYFETFGAFILVVPIVIEFIKRFIPTEANSIFIQLISWLTGIVLAMAAWLLNLGFFAEIEIWYQALVIGIGATLAANGVFDTGLITWILGLIGIKSKKAY